MWRTFVLTRLALPMVFGLLVSFLSLSLFPPTPGEAHLAAITKTFDGGGGNNEWNNAANWDPDGLPGRPMS